MPVDGKSLPLKDLRRDRGGSSAIKLPRRTFARKVPRKTGRAANPRLTLSVQN